MEPSIHPVSIVPDDLVRKYLHSRGMPPEIIEWKYFDRIFNGDRDRGYVAMHNGQVCAFLGFIPFEIGYRSQSWKASWLCDWSRAPIDAARGTGRKLITEAMRGHDHLIGLAGSAIAQRIHPLIASRTFLHSGIRFERTLRLAAIQQKISRRIPLLRRVHLPKLGMLPLGLPLRRSARPLTKIVNGVSTKIEALLGVSCTDGWFPRYDMAYLEWQLARCPVIMCWTSYIPADSRVPAAALLWRSVSSTGCWRLALLYEEGAKDEIGTVLKESLQHIYTQGGVSVAILVSRLETELAATIRDNGFRQCREAEPLYIYSGRSTSQPIGEMRGLSYLDTDLGYRFPTHD